MQTASSIEEEVTVSNYVGLDIGMESTAVYIMDPEGKILQQAMVLTEPDAIIKYLSESGLSFKRIGMEACPLSQW